MEKKTGRIAPVLWLVGSLCGLLFQVMGWGTCAWWIAVVCMIVTLILAVFFSAKCPGAIGGGILKGVVMAAAFLGYYVGITIVVLAIMLAVAAGIKSRQNGSKQVLAMPFLIIAVLVTVGVMVIF